MHTCVYLRSWPRHSSKSPASCGEVTKMIHILHFWNSQTDNMLIHLYFMALYKNKYAMEATAALMHRASSPVRLVSFSVEVKSSYCIHRTGSTKWISSWVHARFVLVGCSQKPPVWMWQRLVKFTEFTHSSGFINSLNCKSISAQIYSSSQQTWFTHEVLS